MLHSVGVVDGAGAGAGVAVVAVVAAAAAVAEGFVVGWSCRERVPVSRLKGLELPP